MDKLINRIGRIVSYTGCGLMIILLIFSGLNPLTRAAIGASLTWAQTAAVWLAIIIATFMAGLVLQEEGHANINLLPEQLKGLPRKIVRCFNHLLAAVFAILLLFGATAKMLSLQTSGISQPLGAMNFPFWIVFLLFAIGAFVFAMGSVIKLIAVITEPNTRPGTNQ